MINNKNKLKMESLDMTKANIDMIAELFPQVVTEVAEPNGAKDAEGKLILRKAIDFEKLKLVLSAGTGEYVVADDERERYEFTWVGKRQAMIDAATPIRKTLRPCPEESKDWETTENLYIEGDNLEVLKLLQESYLGKVKMIYIDPPYNTGKDFIYKDNFTQSREEYEGELDMFDEDGNRLFQNTETNGRFHSDWCSMIYPRLQLARNLLTDDGVIFISIDDNEVRNLKNICDEVFGEEHFLSWIIWQHSIQPKGYTGIFSIHHNHILAYKKSGFILGSLQRTDENNKAYSNPDNDPKGMWRSGDVRNALYRPNLIYDIISPSGNIIKPCSNGWRWSKSTVEEKIRVGEIVFSTDETRIIRKIYLSSLDGRTPETIWFGKDVGTTRDAMTELKQLFEVAPFDTPKPLNLLKRMMEIANLNEDDIILDFFSGSATTAHAVMQLNAEDDGNRKFIMVQLPEKCDAKSDTAKAGYKNICEIGKERIRRAGTKIAAEQEAKNDDLFTEDTNNLDTGFRVFKLDSTNMKDVYYAAGELKQSDLWDTVSNIKDDRTDIDLLYGCLLDWGVPLSMPHTTEKIDGSTVHTVDSPQTDEVDLIACFDQEVTESTVRAIAARKPMRAVFRDWSFRDSADKINVTEIFKALSPDTTVKVI